VNDVLDDLLGFGFDLRWKSLVSTAKSTLNQCFGSVLDFWQIQMELPTILLFIFVVPFVGTLIIKVYLMKHVLGATNDFTGYSLTSV
jgi:hypothetical protein